MTTEQDIITRVWLHLNAQGKQAMGMDACQYRTSDGLACAVGCLLDDATAAAFDKQDLTAIDDIAADDIDVIPADLRPHVAFLAVLQVAHDNTYSGYSRTWLENWRLAMRGFASARGLTLPEVAT